jgi:hypothetical protein
MRCRWTGKYGLSRGIKSIVLMPEFGYGMRVFVDLDAGWLCLGKGMAGIAERRQQNLLGRHYGGGACRISRLEWQLPSIFGDREGLPVGSQHADR